MNYTEFDFQHLTSQELNFLKNDISYLKEKFDNKKVDNISFSVEPTFSETINVFSKGTRIGEILIDNGYLGNQPDEKNYCASIRFECIFGYSHGGIETSYIESIYTDKNGNFDLNELTKKINKILTKHKNKF